MCMKVCLQMLRNSVALSISTIVFWLSRTMKYLRRRVPVLLRTQAPRSHSLQRASVHTRLQLSISFQDLMTEATAASTSRSKPVVICCRRRSPSPRLRSSCQLQAWYYCYADGEPRIKKRMQQSRIGRPEKRHLRCLAPPSFQGSALERTDLVALPDCDGSSLVFCDKSTQILSETAELRWKHRHLGHLGTPTNQKPFHPV